MAHLAAEANEETRRRAVWRLLRWRMNAQGNLRGRRPPFPVNGGPIPVSPRCSCSSTGPPLTGVLRGRGLTGVGLTGTPYFRTYGNRKSRNGDPRKNAVSVSMPRPMPDDGSGGIAATTRSERLTAAVHRWAAKGGAEWERVVGGLRTAALPVRHRPSPSRHYRYCRLPWVRAAVWSAPPVWRLPGTVRGGR